MALSNDKKKKDQDKTKETEKQKIDVDKIDLEKHKEYTTDNPGTLDKPHSVGGAVVKPEDMGKVKGRAVTAMQQQTEKQMSQLYDQMQMLANQANEIKERVEVSERIYAAQMNFEPQIAQTYYLYEKEDGTDVVSMIGPDEWGKNKPYRYFIASATLLADHTWEVHREEKEL